MHVVSGKGHYATMWGAGPTEPCKNETRMGLFLMDSGSTEGLIIIVIERSQMVVGVYQMM